MPFTTFFVRRVAPSLQASVHWLQSDHSVPFKGQGPGEVMVVVGAVVVDGAVLVVDVVQA